MSSDLYRVGLDYLRILRGIQRVSAFSRNADVVVAFLHLRLGLIVRAQTFTIAQTTRSATPLCEESKLGFAAHYRCMGPTVVHGSVEQLERGTA